MDELDSGLLNRMKQLLFETVSSNTEYKRLQVEIDKNIGELENIRILLERREVTIPKNFIENDLIEQSDRVIVRRSQEIRLSRRLERSNAFDEGFERIRKHFEKERDFPIPISYKERDGFELGRWVANVRRHFRMGSPRLSPLNKQRLESLSGWTWTSTPHNVAKDEGMDRNKSLSQLSEAENKWVSNLSNTSDPFFAPETKKAFIDFGAPLNKKIYEMIKEAGTPLHISNIYIRLRDQDTVIPGKGDESAIVSRIHRAKNLFYRIENLPGTYGISEWQYDKEKGKEILNWAKKVRETRAHIVPRQNRLDIIAPREDIEDIIFE